jgi:hypothetical protein
MNLALLVALAGPALATDAGASLAIVGVRSSSGHRPLHRGLSGWLRLETERSFDLEAELVWVTAKEDFLDERLRTHLLRPAVSASWSTGTRRAQVSGSAGICLNLYAGGLDTLVVQLRPGVKARIGVDMPIGESWWLRWHFGLASRGVSADVETGLGLGMSL